MNTMVIRIKHGNDIYISAPYSQEKRAEIELMIDDVIRGKAVLAIILKDGMKAYFPLAVLAHSTITIEYIEEEKNQEDQNPEMEK